MRLSVLLLSFLIAGQAGALGSSLYPDLMEFDEAMALYRAGEFDRARRAFSHLAELGDPAAQFNLGVMLAKGEGGEPDAITGTAWLQWAADSGLPGAVEVLAIMASRLDEDAQEQGAQVLAGLQAGGSQSEQRTGPSDTDDGYWACFERNRHQPPPIYPMRALDQDRVGFAMLHFLVGPEGNFDAIHAIPDGHHYGPFGPAAQEGARRWHAHGCRTQRYRYMMQSVVFEMEDGFGDLSISPARKQWAGKVLAEARAGSPEQSYFVGMLASLYETYFAVDADERLSLLHRAAVAGYPDARFEYWRAAGARGERWLLLAARQGYPPALFALRKRQHLPREDRRQALHRAAEAGFLPAVFLAVRHLAAHPDASQRDGARALQLSSMVHHRILRGDPSMAEVHAMALAENGQFKDAVSWQKRAVSTGRRLGRDTTGAAARLARYEAGEPWRDPHLSSDPGGEDDG